MVERQIVARGVSDPAVLKAMRTVPRHEFVPEELRGMAYNDHPLPIGQGQTISQPYIVAYMSEALHLKAGQKVLEIGTGSGYQAAVLAAMGAKVYSIEILPALSRRAAADLKRLGYGAVRLKVGDGYKGWPQEAPFDAIIVTAAAPHIPPPLVEQLRPGGRMIIPVGSGGIEELTLVEKSAQGKVTTRGLMAVRFVPLVREKK
ncbi:MAG: protein-L-isoaspartate(D-aspartate) O-methyltransferase [Thermodesulfobacteriota bacterium]